MKTRGRAYYQARAFAELAGITVRTLHHYDRLGLLKPCARTEAGYRCYGEHEFARLQQILTLKFLGFPLQQIKQLLDRNTLDLPATLRLQRGIIEKQHRQLELAIQAIDQAEHALAAGGSDAEPDWQTFRRIIEVIAMQNEREWVKRYYSEEQLQELGKRWSPALQQQVDREWAELIRDVEAALGEGPASAQAQVLAGRWSALIQGFTGGDPGIAESLKKLYADQAHWPSSFTKPYREEVEAFIDKALRIRTQR